MTKELKYKKYCIGVYDYYSCPPTVTLLKLREQGFDLSKEIQQTLDPILGEFIYIQFENAKEINPEVVYKPQLPTVPPPEPLKEENKSWLKSVLQKVSNLFKTK